MITEGINTRSSWRSTGSLLSAFVLMMIFASQTIAQDWPRFRSDTQLRGRSVLKSSGKDQPSSFIEYQLGGGSVQPLLADLNGDGRPEIIYLRQGRLVAASQDGTLLINSFFGATELVTAEDLDQDGSAAEIVAINSDKRLLMVINADGTMRWQYQFPEFVALSSNFCKIADISPDHTGKEIIVFPDHTKTQDDAHGYFFTSSGLLYNSPLVPNLSGGQLNFPQLAIGDLEGNGTLQVVVVGRPRLMIYNGAGELKQQLDFREGDPEGRHYGLLTLADVNGDHTLEAVIIGDDIPASATNNKSMAITVLQLTPTIKRLWGTSFPQQTIHAPFNSIVDLDGDGRSEIVLNLWNGSEQQIRVYRGDGDPNNPGQPLLLTTISGAYVWDIQDINSDLHPDLMASSETIENPVLSLNSVLRIFKLAAQAGNTLMFLDAAKPLTGMYVQTHVPMLANESAQIGSSDNSRMKNLILADGSTTDFLTYSRNTLGTTNIQERSLIAGANKFRIKTDLDTLRPGPVRAILSSKIGSESFLINQEVDGQLTGELVIYNRKKEKLKLTAGAPVFTGSGFSTEVRVADIDDDGANEILVRAASGRILILAYNEQLNSLSQIGNFAGNATPIIQALDGNKGRPQIITTANDNGRLRLVVYDTQTMHSGELKVIERWGRTFPDITANTDVELTTGHFSGTSRFDIFLATPRGLSMVVSSLDGTTSWSRTDIFTFGNHVSVRDANHDGKDDIYIVANNLYQIVDGSHGLTLAGPINVATLGGDFFSTPILSGDNEVLLVGPGTVIKMLDQGKLLWNFTKTVNGKPAQRQVTRTLMGLAELGNGSSFDRIGGNYGENDLFYGYDYATGLLSFKTPYQPITDIITADLDGDGSDEFIFGTVDAEIVALHASDGSLLWSIKVDSFPNDPILATMGSDRHPALIFAPGDGSVRMYQLNSSPAMSARATKSLKAENIKPERIKSHRD